MRVCIHGALGRMGRRLLAFAHADADLTVSAAVEFDGHPLVGRPVGPPAGVSDLDVELSTDLAAAMAQSDVAISFALPEPSVACAEVAAVAGVPCVVGTTGFSADQDARLGTIAGTVALVQAANFAIGVNVLFKIAEEVAARLGDEFDMEIVEMHHNQKVDAPSGTALRLAEGMARGGNRQLDTVARYGRQGHVGKRPPGEIGIMALRGGDVVGEHTAIFAGTGERIELTHRAQSRDLFATGALRAAKWIAAQAPGRYDMFDVLALR